MLLYIIYNRKNYGGKWIMREKDLMEALKEFLEMEDLNKESIFEKDKMDSFEKMNLLVLLEEYSMKELSIIELFQCITIGEICKLCFE